MGFWWDDYLWCNFLLFLASSVKTLLGPLHRCMHDLINFFFYKHCSFSGLLINFVIAEWIMTCLLWSSFNLKISLFLFSKLQYCWLESSESMYMRHKIVFIARLTDHGWLTDWLTNQLTDQPTNRLTDRPTDRPTDRLTDRPKDLTGWSNEWMNK